MKDLLADRAAGDGRLEARARPPGIDVEPAAAGVARFHRQRLRPAALAQVDEDPLDALFVELAVVPAPGKAG